MKKVLFILLSSITLICTAQEKIYLTTGDTLIGIITPIDGDRSKILKEDGKTSIVSNSIIKKTEKILSKSDTAGAMLIESADITQLSFKCSLVGVGIAVIGAVIASPAVAIAGAVAIIASEIYAITAWARIRTAGEILKKRNI